MLEAIDKVYDFPASLLTALLQANPSAAKNERIMSALEERTEPLSELQLYLIRQGINIFSLKEQLELEIAFLDEERNIAISDGLRDLSTVEDGVDHSSEIQTLQLMEFSPTDGYAVLEYLIASGQTFDILTKFDAIPQNYLLSDWQTEEHSELRTLYELEAEKNYSYDFSGTEIELLESLTISKYSEVAVKSAKLLALQNRGFTNDPIFGNLADGYRAERFSIVQPVELELHIYPNPTIESAIVELPAINYYQRYFLVDGLGQVVLEGDISAQELVLTIPTLALSTGVYTLTLQGMETKFSTQIIKQ